MADALKELSAAIDVRANEIFNCDGENRPGEFQELVDAKDLARALARLLLGQSLRAAFGSPGDWGYSSPIGKALATAYLEVGTDARMVLVFVDVGGGEDV